MQSLYQKRRYPECEAERGGQWTYAPSGVILPFKCVSHLRRFCFYVVPITCRDTFGFGGSGVKIGFQWCVSFFPVAPSLIRAMQLS
jgi:hypothetical protein